MTSSLARFFETEAPKLVRFLRRFGSSVSPEDLAQESFAQLCTADPARVEHPRGYLYRTARNLAINEHQRVRRSPIRSIRESAMADIADADPGPEAKVIAAETTAALEAALAQLPEHKRQALLLFKVEGLSHKEIGQRLGVSHRTVERYVADALAHCHAVLRASED